MFDEFRQYVKEILKERNLTYSQLGNSVGMCESTIKAFMCGASDSRRIAERIADGLCISLRYESGKYICIDSTKESTHAKE